MPRTCSPVLIVVLGGVLAGAFAAVDPAAAREERPGIKVHAAGARTDTLTASWREVYRVAAIELEKNDWTIQQEDTAQRRIVTHWKRVDHPLARLVYGDLQARCVVDVTPLSESTTAVTIRGGMAGPEDLDHSPVFAAAQHAYQHATERWANRVRAELARLATVEPARVR